MRYLNSTIILGFYHASLVGLNNYQLDFLTHEIKYPQMIEFSGFFSNKIISPNGVELPLLCTIIIRK